jgi:hypothetical protein
MHGLRRVTGSTTASQIEPTMEVIRDMHGTHALCLTHAHGWHLPGVMSKGIIQQHRGRTVSEAVATVHTTNDGIMVHAARRL